MQFPKQLGHAELAVIVDTIRFALYADRDESDAHYWNPDKEWRGADTLEIIADVLHRNDLVPTEPGPIELGHDRAPPQ